MLPDAVDIENHSIFLRYGNYKIRKLDQSYFILLGSNLEEQFPFKILQKRTDGSVVDGIQYKYMLSETNYSTDPPDVRIAVVPWGDGNQVLVAQGPESGTKSFDLFVKNTEKYYYDKFVFASHPNGDALPKAIYIVTKSGTMKHLIDHSVGRVEEIPIGTSSGFHIVFDFPDDYSQVFKSSYFDIMNPKFVLQK